MYLESSSATIASDRPRALLGLKNKYAFFPFFFRKVTEQDEYTLPYRQTMVLLQPSVLSLLKLIEDKLQGTNI